MNFFFLATYEKRANYYHTHTLTKSVIFYCKQKIILFWNFSSDWSIKHFASSFFHHSFGSSILKKMIYRKAPALTCCCWGSWKQPKMFFSFLFFSLFQFILAHWRGQFVTHNLLFCSRSHTLYIQYISIYHVPLMMFYRKSALLTLILIWWPFLPSWLMRYQRHTCVTFKCFWDTRWWFNNRLRHKLIYISHLTTRDSLMYSLRVEECIISAPWDIDIIAHKILLFKINICPPTILIKCVHTHKFTESQEL